MGLPGRKRSASRRKKWPRHGRRSIPRCAMRSPRPPIRFAHFAKRQMPESCSDSPDGGPDNGPACAPARLRWMLCAQRTASAAFHAADDGNSRAGGRSRAHRRGFAEARARNACRGASARNHRVLSPRRRARDCGVGLRNREPAARRQDRGPGQSLRNRGQAPRRIRLRHRYARWPNGNRRHQRARQRGRHCQRPRGAGGARS